MSEFGVIGVAIVIFPLCCIAFRQEPFCKDLFHNCWCCCCQEQNPTVQTAYNINTPNNINHITPIHNHQKMSALRFKKAIIKNKHNDAKATHKKIKSMQKQIQLLKHINEQMCLHVGTMNRQLIQLRTQVQDIDEYVENFTNEYDLLVAINSKKIDAIEPRILQKIGFQQAISPVLKSKKETIPNTNPNLFATAPLFPTTQSDTPTPTLQLPQQLILDSSYDDTIHNDVVFSPIPDFEL